MNVFSFILSNNPYNNIGLTNHFFPALSLTFLQNTDSVDRSQFSTVDERL